MLLLIAVAFISSMVGYVAGASGKTTPAASGASAPPSAASSPTAAATTASPAQPAPAAFKKKTLARFSGSGIENTSRFTVPGAGNWELKWSYNCASAGGSGNFIVDEDNGNDFNGANVNELGAGGHGITHVYGDAGSHYLDVNSECNWSMVAVSLP